MLVLTRYAGEEIVIGDDVVVSILRVWPEGRVHIGVQAPREITVHRREVYEKIREEKKASGE